MLRKERMYKARAGYRNDVDTRLHQLEAESRQLRQENHDLKLRLETLLCTIAKSEQK